MENKINFLKYFFFNEKFKENLQIENTEKEFWGCVLFFWLFDEIFSIYS